MVTNVTSLLKTVKAVEDEATKGTRALEATTEHIRQELAVSASLGHRGLGSESRVVIDSELAPRAHTHTHTHRCRYTVSCSLPDFLHKLHSCLPLPHPFPP